MEVLFLDDIKGKAYEKMVDIVCKYSNEFSLTIYSKHYAHKTEKLGRELRKYLIDSRDIKIWEFYCSNSWDKREFFYEMNDNTKEILKKYSTSLYSWQRNNDLPDELCFFKEGRKRWIVSIGHERYSGIVEYTEEELNEIKSIQAINSDNGCDK